jgi:hypothetical protein
MTIWVILMTTTQVLSYATIVRYLVYQQGKEIDLLVGNVQDLGIGTFTRSLLRASAPHSQTPHTCTSVLTCSIDASLQEAVSAMQERCRSSQTLSSLL